MKHLPLSPLSLDQLTRDLWGQFDPPAIAQLAQLAEVGCYQPKFYKAPGDDQEVIAAYDYLAYGLKITPGSIIAGFYLPVNPATLAPPAFNFQMYDKSLDRRLFSDPVASLFLSNFKPTCQNAYAAQIGSFPNLGPHGYPVVGDGLFLTEFWETSGAAQRIELVIGVLEVCG